jgi:hypothetical protein
MQRDKKSGPGSSSPKDSLSLPDLESLKNPNTMALWDQKRLTPHPLS